MQKYCQGMCKVLFYAEGLDQSSLYHFWGYRALRRGLTLLLFTLSAFAFLFRWFVISLRLWLSLLDRFLDLI